MRVQFAVLVTVMLMVTTIISKQKCQSSSGSDGNFDDEIEETIEISTGENTFSRADVLFIVDMSTSISGHTETIIGSLKNLTSHLSISKDMINIALIECRGVFKSISEMTEGKKTVVKLHFNEGIKHNTFNDEIDKFKVGYGNPFIVCFNAAMEEIFLKDEGDRPDAKNVIVFISDMKFETNIFTDHPDKYDQEPKSQLQQLKTDNTTIISIAFCNEINIKYYNSSEHCRKINTRVASEPKYALDMYDFKADSPQIIEALQNVVSCKQYAYLSKCKWASDQTCQRNIYMSKQFSTGECEKYANKSQLRDDTNFICASVTKINVTNMTCVNNGGKTCYFFMYEIRRNVSLDSKLRKPGAAETDVQNCINTSPKQYTCPVGICTHCDSIDYSFENCDNLVLLKNCMKNMRNVCHIDVDIDNRCYPLYYAKNKTNFVEEFSADLVAQSAKVLTGTVKELCEDNRLRRNCSGWLYKYFKIDHFKICKKVGSAVSVDCLEDFGKQACYPVEEKNIEKICDFLCNKNQNNYIQCIEEKMEIYNRKYGNTYPCKKHVAAISDLRKNKEKDQSKKNKSTGVIIAVVVLVLVALIIGVVLAVVLRSRKKAKKNISTPAKLTLEKSAAMQANLTSLQTLKHIRTSVPSKISMASKFSRGSKSLNSSKTSTKVGKKITDEHLSKHKYKNTGSECASKNKLLSKKISKN